MSLLAVTDLDCRYGLLQAVRGVTLEVDEGETVALIGANGAGKSTLLRSIAGAHRPHSGSVRFDGADITRTAAHSRVRLGISLVPEGRRLFAGLTVEENLRVAAPSGVPARSAGGGRHWTVESVLETFPFLKPRLRSLAATLSGGEQQAVAIGRGLMSNPRLLLLDEASLGLAPVAVDAVYRSLADVIRAGTTVLLVEQDLTRALTVADRVICLLEGRVVLQGDASSLNRDRIVNAYFGLRRASA